MGGPRAGCSAVAEVTWHEAGPGGSQGDWDWEASAKLKDISQLDHFWSSSHHADCVFC